MEATYSSETSVGFQLRGVISQKIELFKKLKVWGGLLMLIMLSFEEINGRNQC
jgi:hypothetical protein